MKTAKMIPPLNFQTLKPGKIHRGSYPRPINYKFLKRLQLKTILSLTPQPITVENDPELIHFITNQNIELIHINVNKQDDTVKRKKRTTNIDPPVINRILEIILNLDNAPLYIHCLNGGEVSSIVVAIYRKLSLWSSVSIFNEYLIFNKNSLNLNIRKFIQEFKIELNLDKDDIDWLWTGLNRQIVENHPILKGISSA